MANSLLAHLYSHIKGSQEDVATISLQYILSQSAILNREFSKLLGYALHLDLDQELNYVCQASGDNLERPDIAGISADGKELVLCEAKFYAGLTENQPVNYLKRIKKNEGLGLVFICPEARKITLWNKLLELCQEQTVEMIADGCATVNDVRMAITTWDSLIESLRHVASTEAVQLLPDIHQLEGFCQMMDNDAFIPFSTEDSGPENAAREERHYQVLDAVFNLILTDKSLKGSAKGLRSTPYRNGYVRYIRTLDYSLAIYYDRPAWREKGTEETPYWVAIVDSDFKQPAQFREAFKAYPDSSKSTINNWMVLALFAPTNVPLDDVASGLKRQIMEYIQVLNEKCNDLKG